MHERRHIKCNWQERLYIIYAAQQWKQTACVVTFLTIKLYPDPHAAWVTAPRPFVLFTGEICLYYVIFIWLFLLQGIKTPRWNDPLQSNNVNKRSHTNERLAGGSDLKRWYFLSEEKSSEFRFCRRNAVINATYLTVACNERLLLTVAPAHKEFSSMETGPVLIELGSLDFIAPKTFRGQDKWVVNNWKCAHFLSLLFGSCAGRQEEGYCGWKKGRPCRFLFNFKRASSNR